jgi:hypothetical protein
MQQEPELTLERDAPKPQLDNAQKRALIEAELLKDASRSDHEIARVVGNKICHKTVAARRREMRLANTRGNSSPPQTRAEAIDVVRLLSTTLAKNGLDPNDPTLFPILTAAAQRNEKKFNPFDPADDCLVAPERLGLACFVNTRSNVVIANGNERDGIDEMVQVNPIDLPALIRQLGEILSEIRDGAYATGAEDNSDG